MTDEERQKLCKWLRFVSEEHWWADQCEEAADEIERLAKELAEASAKIDELELAKEYIENDALERDLG